MLCICNGFLDQTSYSPCSCYLWSTFSKFAVDCFKHETIFAGRLYDLHDVSQHLAETHPANDQSDVGIDNLRTELEEAESIYEQADILHYLYVTR